MYSSDMSCYIPLTADQMHQTANLFFSPYCWVVSLTPKGYAGAIDHNLTADLLDTLADNDEERIRHSEDHPDVDELDVAGRGQST